MGVIASRCHERVSAHISQQPHIQTSRNFLHMLTAAVARSSSDHNETRYVLTVLWITGRLKLPFAMANALVHRRHASWCENVIFPHPCFYLVPPAKGSFQHLACSNALHES